MDNNIYFDGKTAQSHDCAVGFYDSTIHITLLQNQNMIIWDKSHISDFTLKNDVLIIKYGNFPHQTLECRGESSSIYYNKLAANRIDKKAEGFWAKNFNKIAIALCVIFIATCFAGYFIILPWAGEKSATLIPKDIEESLGDNLYESILQSSTEEDSATFYANKFISKLKVNSDYDIQVTVVESEQINAFALPGGHIFIYSEIIKQANSYEEFAALLSHEISHVTYQHSLKSICRSAASSFFIAFLFGDVTGISSGILQQANEFKQLHYSRELETQADDKGYEMMIQNNISPKGMIDLLTLLKNQSDDMDEMTKYFSTHPETEERIKNIQSKPLASKKFEQSEDLKMIFNTIKSHLD